MKKQRFSPILLAVLLLCASLAPAALASIAADEAMIYDVNYLVEGTTSPTAHVADYTYYAASSQLAKKANVYEKASSSSSKLGSIPAGNWLVVLNPYRTVPQNYLPASERADYSAWTPVLYDGGLAYVQRSAFTPKGAKRPSFYNLYTDDDNGGYFATARQDITVYSKTGNKGTKLGTVSKGSMVMCISSKKDGYLRVVVGPNLGYVKTSSLNVIKKDKLNLSVGKAADSYLDPPDWDYLGLISPEDREAANRLYNGFGYQRTFVLNEVGAGGMIIEYQLPTAAQADMVEEQFRLDGSVRQEDTDTEESMIFDTMDGSSLYFYRNENTLIFYHGSSGKVTAALEAYHGEALYVHKDA